MSEQPAGSLSIFFPAFNEEGIIERTVRDAVAAAQRDVSDFEVIVVDDGSKDATADIVSALAAKDPRVRLVRHEVNRGYGAALRTGFASATKDFVFFSDADGQFHLDELPATLELAHGAPVVAGYRIKRSDPWHRLVIARTYRLVIWTMFGLRIRDIDCAWKLFRRETLGAVELESNGAFISSELLIKLGRAGVPIKEIGVHHYPRTTGVSKGATPKVILKTIRDIVRLRLGMPLTPAAQRQHA
ncbi:MAG TPA: glycosyltransferase family 2 protein [Candidatus Eremiobacteraceae bacterium]|nr:glycosyltransferase family 2 protein [Candidatus Eremiobacteraceae bacterium]